MNCRVRPSMASAELRHCGIFEVFGETLRSIRSTSTVCILSCLTNFLTMCQGDSSSAAVRVEPVLREVHEVVLSFCQEFPERTWLLAPPMYRTTPLWYLDGLPEILVKFSSIFSQEQPRNLLLMPSVPNQVLEADGIHLTPYSGFEFVVALFDKAAELIDNLKKNPTSLVGVHSESIRCLEDRVSVVEQDHKRLNKSVETKHAANAESWDFAENQRFVFIVCVGSYCFMVLLIKRFSCHGTEIQRFKLF